MKLFTHPASPYVRKALVAAHETGLIGRIERIDIAIAPTNPHDDLNRSNPIGKIPTLVLDDGTALFDSRVICEYLDGLHAGPKLFPAGTDRWEVLRMQAIGDGILDAGVSIRYETFLRPEDKRWPDWIAGQKAKIARAVDALEPTAAGLGDRVDIGTIACGVALGYLDFRFADDDWRGSHPELARWYERFGSRPSMRATVPG